MRAVLHHRVPGEVPLTRSGFGRVGGPVMVALVMAAWSRSASAAALGGVGGSVGLLAAIATWLLFKGWQAHLELGGIPALVGLLALAGGVALLCRAASTGFRFSGRPGYGLVAKRAALSNAPVLAPVQLPAGIDRELLVADLNRHFVDLQSAWDLGSREALSRLTTPDMLEELCAASVAGIAAPTRTEVIHIEAHLLMFEERGAAQVVCVEFSGMVQEVVAGAPAPFREFWMLTRALDAPAGWRLARHQALL